MQYILASASPRREQLLKLLIPDFIVDPSVVVEAPGDFLPHELVVQLARDKALDVAQRYERGIVIGADTCVAVQGKVLMKPADENQAYEMLRLLQGNTHRVYTGLFIVNVSTRVLLAGYAETKVTMQPLCDREILEYIATKEPMDKAGAYGIQGNAAKYICGIEGCYYNVVGLPLHKLYTMLKQMGCDV